MADKKITQLDELTELAEEDLFVVVDDPAGNSVSKKVTLETVVDYVAASEDISAVIAAATPEVPEVVFNDQNNVVCNAVFS